jgi:hypothetical protein
VKRELPRILRDALRQELNGCISELPNKLEGSISGIVDRVMQGLRSSQEHPNTPNAAIGQTPSETLASDDTMNEHAVLCGSPLTARDDHKDLKPSRFPGIPYRDTGLTASGLQVDSLTAPGLAASADEHGDSVTWHHYGDFFHPSPPSKQYGTLEFDVALEENSVEDSCFYYSREEIDEAYLESAEKAILEGNF